ncbi:MAG: response regulator [Cyclobacteriaceae bacterium]|nr:response regulator [Cyclobacteriaceae bacterium]
MTESKNHCVMLIDDNEIDNLINQKTIEASNFAKNIYVHSSAKSAIEFLRNVEKIKDLAEQVLPDIIFLDIDMPLMDGFQFMDEFNKLSNETKSKSKVIILTSSVNPQDMNKSMNYESVMKYLTKPLTQESLGKI